MPKPTLERLWAVSVKKPGAEHRVNSRTVDFELARFCQFKSGNKLREKQVQGDVVPGEIDRTRDWQVERNRDGGALLRLKTILKCRTFLFEHANKYL